ncbi:MAG: DUF2637 domain-containing protein [Anaerolineales bacterium]|nr:DUF2637 domain-containing protein [Anaerolineales bacterium]
MNPSKIIAWLTGVLTLLLALFSFILSFNALTDLAAKKGVSVPPLFPFIVEFAVVIFSMNALYRSLHGESAKWQWALIIGASLLAGLFNVAHATTDLLSRVMAAMPSLFLLLSFETFLGQVKHAVKRQALVKSMADLNQEVDTKRQELDQMIASKQAEFETLVEAKQNELATKSKELDTLIDAKQAEIEKLTSKLEGLKQELLDTKNAQNGSLLLARQTKAEQDQVTRERRLTTLRDILNVNSQAQPSTLAKQLGVSRQTIYNDLSALQEQGFVHKNGHGWEVSK